ncbi:MAG: transcriptional repressor, partial [Candidatus Marinimicrobia bacterium]|nr:transcriptional repressor [Candidatus Neomarinimicrobiota bacterium]
RYEINLPDAHHDHLICEECGKIIEFFNPEIEGLQNNICSKYSFHSTNHTMIIHGTCEDCQKKEKVK